jgi:hypothetical protein
MKRIGVISRAPGRGDSGATRRSGFAIPDGTFEHPLRTVKGQTTESPLMKDR